MPAWLCGSSASASSLIPALSDGALHLSWHCGRDGPLWPETGWPDSCFCFSSITSDGTPLHPEQRGSSTSGSRAAPSFAMPTLRWGIKAPKDAWQDQGKTSPSQGLEDCSRGSPQAKSSLHVPAEGKSLAPA